MFVSIYPNNFMVTTTCTCRSYTLIIQDRHMQDCMDMDMNTINREKEMNYNREIFIENKYIKKVKKSVIPCDERLWIQHHEKCRR